MKRTLLGLAIVLLSATLSFAQREISGKVTDEKGEVLIGASVIALGTTTGTVTDLDGKYSLNVPSGATTISISYTGYASQDITLGTSNVYDVVMQESAAVLSEVVVVGYGTQQKRAVTGTIATIKGEELSEIQAQSFDQVLQGRAAGVNVNLPNGVLNNPPVFRIRGISSINLSSFPLVVIDGVPTYTGDGFLANSAGNNPLSNLNPNDIESIDILKDASATAIYGSRASAGVVLITTKKGKAGKAKVNYQGSTSWQRVVNLPDLLNAQEYVKFKNEAAVNAGLPTQFFLDSLNGQLIDTDWFDFIYRTGYSHNHNLSFSGGSEATTYYLAMGYTNQQGMIVANDFSRFSGRLNLEHKVNDRLRLGAILGYSNSTNNAPNTGSLPGQAFNTSGLGRLPLITAPNVGAYRADGSYNISSTNRIGRGKNLQEISFVNPAPIIDLNRFISESAQIQASAFAQWEFFKGLNIRTQYGIDNILFENESFQTPIHGDGFGSNGFAANSVIKNTRWNWQNTLNFNRTLGGKHNVGVVLGNEQQYTVSEGWGASRTQLADPFFTTYQGNFTTINPAGNFQGENYLLSYFGRLNYDFMSKYFLTFNLRQDEYSAFAVGKKKSTFWGASAGYTISEEEFWKNSLGKVVNYFKLRGSYGIVGNTNGIGDFASLSLYGSGLYGPYPTVFFSQAGNDQLTWETSKKTDVGVVFGLFNDRIQGEYTYFNNLIDGLILGVPQSPSKGIPGNNILANVGSMENRGHEFTLSATIIKKGKFTWATSANLTLMENEINTLADGGSDIFGATAGLETANIIRIGESIGSLYVIPTAGVNPENGRRIFVKRDGRQVQYNHVVPAGQSRWTYLDGTTAPAATVSQDGVVFGPTLPKWFGGWDNTFTYGNIDLNLQFNFAGGNYIYNGTKAGLRDMRFWNNHTDVLDAWTESNKDGTIPRAVFGDNVSNGSAAPISENVEKGDFLRLRNVTLGYKLPAEILSRAKISSLRVYGNINNALLFTNYSGTDPEVSTNGNLNTAPGVDRNSVPMPRTYTLGINIGF